MKLEFLGTRGYIDTRSRRHRRHSSLKISYYHHNLVIDCGADWRDHPDAFNADALVVTHAHPDHVDGLTGGTAVPVYATAISWQKMRAFPIAHRRNVVAGRAFHIGRMVLKAFPVQHSVRAPAVGYQVTAGRACIFYAPDVVYIPDRSRALRGVKIYIGDGATMSESFVRPQGETLVGHAPVRTQLGWCAKEGVPRAIVTHCGKEIVDGDERRIGAKLRAMARERNVDAQIAHDGMKLVLR